MEHDLILQLTQFGAAGLIGLLWIVERRHAMQRDRQLAESHARIVRQQHEIGALLDVVKDNTRAVTALEQSQMHLSSLIRMMIGTRAAARAAAESTTGAAAGRDDTSSGPQAQAAADARRS